MQLLGHEARAIFDRNAIVSEGNLNAAAARLAAQLQADGVESGSRFRAAKPGPAGLA